MSDCRGRNDDVGTGGTIVLGSSYRMRKILIGDGMSFIGICLSITGLGALGYQCLVWINFGVWPPLAFRLVLELIGARERAFGWQPVEKIAARILDLPLSGVLFAVGFVAVIFGMAITEGCSRPSGVAEGDRAGSMPDAAKI